MFLQSLFAHQIPHLGPPTKASKNGKQAKTGGGSKKREVKGGQNKKGKQRRQKLKRSFIIVF